MRQLILDGLGVLLILAAPFVGVLPGPGGVFIFAGGLWLLSHNHGWAKRLLETIKEKGSNLVDILFVDKPFWQAIYDITALLLIACGIYILDTRSGTIPIVFASLLNVFGISILLGNRRRIQRLTKLLTRSKKSKDKR